MKDLPRIIMFQSPPGTYLVVDEALIRTSQKESCLQGIQAKIMPWEPSKIKDFDKLRTPDFVLKIG
jgi:hypothetical protein